MNTWSNKIKTRLSQSLVLLLTGGLLAAAAPLKEGDAFPDLAKCGLEGTLPDLHGKVVLVDFFASWCDPCKESFPVMEEMHRLYGSKGLVVVAVNLDKKKEDMADFLKQHPASFTIVRDAGNALVRQVKIPTMPSSFLLGRDGRVRVFHRGFKGAETRQEYVKEIEALLK
jgi:thiol-disulfide isomerase/thioredoxin